MIVWFVTREHMILQVMLVMHKDGDRAKRGFYLEISIFILIMLWRRHFGTYNDIINLVMFKLWCVEKYFKFSHVLGIINYDVWISSFIYLI